MGWVTLALIAGIVLLAISIYNRLVAGRNRFKNAFAQIDVQMTRRHDLIPNLVETAKGYMSHERETLEGVINARNSAVSGLRNAAKDPSDPEAMKQLAKAEQGLSGAARFVPPRYVSKASSPSRARLSSALRYALPSAEQCIGRVVPSCSRTATRWTDGKNAK